MILRLHKSMAVAYLQNESVNDGLANVPYAGSRPPRRFRR
jgi:hypothetical protein